VQLVNTCSWPNKVAREITSLNTKKELKGLISKLVKPNENVYTDEHKSYTKLNCFNKKQSSIESVHM